MNKNIGLTFIELLISITLIVLLCFLCAPAGVMLYQKNQLQVREKEIITALYYARHTAFLQGVTLALTPLPESSDWSQGMILFVDNKNHRFHSSSKLLQQWHWTQSSIKLGWHGFHSKNYLLFSSELKHMAASGHFLLQNPQSEPIKLVVNRFGRVLRQQNS
ncbi:pilus assembly FimT family protein [Legionella tunisiensis]|uniref:pilus assembly FimT family protein n=1 Tax=Legionella tunisiensis TaxID=1034944 RepID=UPI00035FE7B4|nr:GspH/FimT family pseudopilin [Legionella tunisiensis]